MDQKEIKETLKSILTYEFGNDSITDLRISVNRGVVSFQGTLLIDVRVQKTETETEAASKDMQMVHTIVAINWHLDPTVVQQTFARVGDEDDIVAHVLNPAVSETLKAATAQLTAEEILAKRIELKHNIDTMLAARLKQYNVMVDDVSLVNLKFSEHYSNAIEQKQVAEQRSQQAEYEAKQAEVDARAAVARARGEAQSSLERAKGEAQSKTLLNHTLTPEILQLEYYKKWNGALPTFMGGSNSGMLLNIPSKALSPKHVNIGDQE